MPKLLAPENSSALLTAPRAHHYRLLFLEFAKQSPTTYVNDLIKLGDGSSAQNSLELVPHHLVIDRCYIHGDPQSDLKRGIALNSAATAILTAPSGISDGAGTHLLGWNGPAPFIHQQLLEAAGENLSCGGAPSIPIWCPRHEIRPPTVAAPAVEEGTPSMRGSNGRQELF